MSSEHAENLLKRFSLEAERENHELIPVELGSLNQLKNLVHLVANGEVSRFKVLISNHFNSYSVYVIFNILVVFFCFVYKL